VSSVRVEAPARLHLGMLAVAGDVARRFGGLGVSISRPAVVLEAQPADDMSVEGAEAERALTFARRSRDALGLEGGAHLRLLETIPPHVGLGSGTKLALAVAQALAALHGRTVEAPALAQAAGRAARSAVGMWTFALGGLVVEGGVRGGTERPAPLLMRHAVPDECRTPTRGFRASPRPRRSGGSCRRPSDRRQSRSSCSRRCCRRSSSATSRSSGPR
jgi:beta-ribofuranosylaminobenzene 5'-phosphate synthase